jgi:hypothetical protein
VKDIYNNFENDSKVSRIRLLDKTENLQTSNKTHQPTTSLFQDLKDLLWTEAELIKGLKNYIQEEENRLLKLKE